MSQQPRDVPRSRGVIPVPANVERFVRAHFGRFFCDANGEVVIGQLPNLPLKLWFGFQLGAIVTRFVLEPLHPYFVVAALVSILWFSVWEIVDGVCPWRRTLGFVVYNLAAFSALRFFEIV